MSLQIKVREIVEGCMPEIIEVGDWIDLRTSRYVELHEGEYMVIPLGIAMELPDGYEAIVAPRSSTFRNFGLVMTNSIGIIDNSYNGDDDDRIFENQPKIEFVKVDSLGNGNRGGFGSTGK